MAHRRNDRRHSRRHCPDHPLIVEGPQFFDTAAAATNHDHVDPARSVQQFDAAHNLFGRFLALHLRRDQNDRNPAVSPPGHRHNIP